MFYVRRVHIDASHRIPANLALFSAQRSENDGLNGSRYLAVILVICPIDGSTPGSVRVRSASLIHELHLPKPLQSGYAGLKHGPLGQIEPSFLCFTYPCERLPEGTLLNQSLDHLDGSCCTCPTFIDFHEVPQYPVRVHSKRAIRVDNIVGSQQKYLLRLNRPDDLRRMGRGYKLATREHFCE